MQFDNYPINMVLDTICQYRRMTTWATCGDGRPREAPLESSNLASSNSDVSVHNSSETHTIYEDTDVPVESRRERFANVSKTESIGLDSFDRAEVGWRVKRIFNEGRVSHLINHDERPKSYLPSLVD